MQPLFKIIGLTILLQLSVFHLLNAQVSINTDNTAPDPSAMLDIKANDKGLLIPRMTSAQKAGISNRVKGLLIYQTDAPQGFYEYDGRAWQLLGTKLSNGQLTTEVNSILDANQPLTGTGPTLTGAAWQSFTAENTGSLQEIEIHYSINAPEGPTIKIYQGEGTSGTVLVNQTFSSGSTGWVRYTFSTPITVTAGQKYTLEVDDATGTWSAIVPPLYTGGIPCCSVPIVGTNYDFTFRTYVMPEVSLLNTDLSNGNIALADSSIFIDSIGNVGIGTITPKNKLDIEGRLAVGSSYSGSDTAAINGAIIEGNVGIGTLDPKNRLDVSGGLAIGSTYAGANTAPTNGLIIEGNLGIRTSTANMPLSFRNNLNQKIALYTPNTGGSFGLGMAPGLLQLFTPSNQDDIAFGYGSSTTFTETMRVKGNGKIGIGTASPNANALLELSSTNRGLRIPSMRSEQRAAISNPATGLLVYQTDSPAGIYEYDGMDWKAIDEGLVNGTVSYGSILNNNTEVVDAYQPLESGTESTNLNVWQSFTAENSGLLTAIDLLVSGRIRAPTIRILEGEGTSGTLLGLQLFPPNDNINERWFKFTFSTPIPVIEGRKYTIVIQDLDPIFGSSLVWHYQSSDPYSGGISSITSSRDLAFKIYVRRPEFSSIDISSGDVGLANNIYVDPVTAQVGIGTTNPIKGKLEVAGEGNGVAINYGYLNDAGDVNTNTGGTNVYSIYASARIACSEFNAFSDARIKNSLGQSNSKKDLETLLAIQITDYQHIDTLKKGNELKKKVIAQQVAEVFPQAVDSTTKEVIPDIFQRATIKAGWVQLATNLKVGERVKLITETSEGIYQVTAVEKDRFQVDDKDKVLSSIPIENADQGVRASSALSESLTTDADDGSAMSGIFVYGREVPDFHTVDYTAIAMLNISAMQEQQEIIETQQMEMDQLKGRLLRLKTLLLRSNETLVKK